MIIANLKTSGVQNTIKNQRLNSTALNLSGHWIHAVGEYTERLPDSPSLQGKGRS